ncbi:U-actitoxin-Avd8d isoform X3 [Exaiptasia diaphana]|uniref:Uncharacterized protein n=1 Tax=Exaiptasia diaphana TaxID=2652724 RepID=A0A913XLS5_EXADI|nr:U-actitoxin-Avd8d isoform X3 [Exaiptasia diaphana]
MAALRLLVLFMVGTILLCQVSADPLWNEILRENLLEQRSNSPGCRNSFSDEICGKIINRRDCTRPYTRKGSFGRRHCRKLCNFCS